MCGNNSKHMFIRLMRQRDSKEEEEDNCEQACLADGRAAAAGGSSLKSAQLCGGLH